MINEPPEVEVTSEPGVQSIVGEEEYGPFLRFTWEEWEEMQKQVLLRFIRFQHAIEQGRTEEALLIALEMHEISCKWLEEVCAQSKN
jgi:hypothetical protein